MMLAGRHCYTCTCVIYYLLYILLVKARATLLVIYVNLNLLPETVTGNGLVAGVSHTHACRCGPCGADGGHIVNVFRPIYCLLRCQFAPVSFDRAAAGARSKMLCAWSDCKNSKPMYVQCRPVFGVWVSMSWPTRSPHMFTMHSRAYSGLLDCRTAGRWHATRTVASTSSLSHYLTRSLSLWLFLLTSDQINIVSHVYIYIYIRAVLWQTNCVLSRCYIPDVGLVPSGYLAYGI